MPDFSSALTSFMSVFTHLGDGPVQIVVIGALYWLFSREMATRLAVLLMVSGALNGLLKQSFAAPRPSWTGSGLGSTMTLSSFGMPSGHAQSATVWFLLPQQTRHVQLLCWVFLYVFAMGYSRVVTGVHSWDQVFMGWAIGMACLQAYLWVEPRVVNALGELSPVTVGLVVSSVIVGVIYLSADTVSRIPEASLATWQEYADRQGIVGAGPAGLRHILAPLGCLTGFIAGAWLDTKEAWRPAQNWQNGLSRFVIGVLVTGGLYVLLKAVLPIDGETVAALTLRFAAAAFLGFSAFYVAPKVMRRVGLFD